MRHVSDKRYFENINFHWFNRNILPFILHFYGSFATFCYEKKLLQSPPTFDAKQLKPQYCQSSFRYRMVDSFSRLFEKVTTDVEVRQTKLILKNIEHSCNDASDPLEQMEEIKSKTEEAVKMESMDKATILSREQQLKMDMETTRFYYQVFK